MLCLFFLFFLSNAGKLPAQNIAFNHLKVENGLSHKSVLAITQDSRGFMWFGTRHGLNRYDGLHFRIYKHDPADSNSISSSYISALGCDSSGRMWIGTEKGLSRYNPAGDNFIQTAIDTIVTCIFTERSGAVWAATPKGLYRVTGGNNKFTVVNIGNGFVQCMFEDRDGSLWAGTTCGLVRLVKNNEGYYKEVFLHDPRNPASLSDNGITTIAADKYGRLWIGTQRNGVNLFHPATRSFSRYLQQNNDAAGILNNNIREIFPDRVGKLWICTQEGLSVMDPLTGKCASYQHNPANKKSLSQNSLHSIFQDRDGSVWIGTYFGGIDVAYSYITAFSVWQNDAKQNSLSNNVVSGLVEDRNADLWIGTEGGGLNHYSRATGRFTAYRHNADDPHSIGSNLVKVVLQDRDGNIWAGTHGGGLNLFDAATHRFKHFLYEGNEDETFNSEIGALLEDSQGRLWVGWQDGVTIYQRKKRELAQITYKIPEVAQKRITCFLEDTKKNVWIGTANGLYKVTQNGCSELLKEGINCIREDAQGKIWIGLYYNGLALYDPASGPEKVYTEKDGLPHNNVLGILEDNWNDLWVSTENGLAVLDPQTNVFRTYTQSDGLAGNEFNYNSFLKDSKGMFFFGGDNGLTSFYPGRIETNRSAANIAITGLSLFNQPVKINGNDGLLKEEISLTREVTFKSSQDVFTLEFALLSFIKPGKNRYAYKLEGFDKNWNEVGITSATYTNLPSGNYTFLVKGANNDGVWSPPAVLRVRILPPFWLTWWACASYVLVAVALLWLIFRFFYLRGMLRKEAELHQEKLNFFTNISHEIRTHLTLITAPIDRMMDTGASGGFFYQQLRNVRDNADRLLRLVSELMDFRKAETGHLRLHRASHNVVPFLETIINNFRDLSQARNIDISFNHNSEEIPLWFDSEQMEKVFFNLLSNAFKFTPEGGAIVIQALLLPGTVKISVSDNGRGIAAGHLDKLFDNYFQGDDHGVQNTGYGIGLSLSRSIVELHKGVITVESRPAVNGTEGRTCFTVTLPAGSQQPEGAAPPRENGGTAAVNGYTRPAPVTVASAATAAEALPQPYTILVAEDNPSLAGLLQETFESSYKVLLCADGQQGWEVATEQIPDIIITDVMMPGMNGFTLCHQLKTDERTSHIPVVILTARSGQADQLHGLETGADVYLAKPFSPKALELNVRNLLALREKIRNRAGALIVAAPENVPVVNNDGAVAVAHSQPAFPGVENPRPLLNKIDHAFLQKAIGFVEEHINDPELCVSLLSEKLAMSPPVLYKKLKAVTNMSVNDFIRSLRMKKAAQLLMEKELAIYEVAYAVGYSDRKYFSKEFKKQFGIAPSEYPDNCKMQDL